MIITAAITNVTTPATMHTSKTAPKGFFPPKLIKKHIRLVFIKLNNKPLFTLKITHSRAGSSTAMMIRPSVYA